MDVRISANDLRGGFSHVTGLELTPDSVTMAIGGTAVELPLPLEGAELQITVPRGGIFKSDGFRFGVAGEWKLTVSVSSMGRITVSAADSHLVISCWSFGIAESEEMELEALDEIMQETGRA
jgi:hypothetical protein